MVQPFGRYDAIDRNTDIIVCVKKTLTYLFKQIWIVSLFWSWLYRIIVLWFSRPYIEYDEIFLTGRRLRTAAVHDNCIYSIIQSKYLCVQSDDFNNYSRCNTRAGAVGATTIAPPPTRTHERFLKICLVYLKMKTCLPKIETLFCLERILQDKKDKPFLKIILGPHLYFVVSFTIIVKGMN